MTIRIQGNARFIADNEFRPKVERCVELLRTSAAPHYNLVNALNLIIRAYSRSGANFADGTIDIARATFDASDTWLASVIVHEAVHFQQYRGGTYTGAVADEQAANRVQVVTLGIIGAPQSEITYMLSQTGGHADLNGDGVYDWRDYNMRNY